jgi:IS6 family transposase
MSQVDNATWTYLYRAVDSAGNTIDFLLSSKRDLTAAKAFLRLATWQAGARRPRVINVDGHAAYPGAIEELKQSAELGRNCRSRRAPYLNNILEQDHRFVKKRLLSSQWFRSVPGAVSTTAGYEAMNIILRGRSTGCRRRHSWPSTVHRPHARRRSLI